MRFHFAGLTEQAVSDSRARFGRNELPAKEPESFWSSLLENFKDPLIRILCIALVITMVLSFFGYADWIEGIGIAAAVFLATFVSTYSEFKNEAQFQELQRQAARISNKVFRDGDLKTIPIGDVVVGDHVLLEPGDRIPADGKLVAGELVCNQMSLTGEPHGKRKSIAPADYVPKREDEFSDQYLLFRGAVIDEGEAVMVVDRVGPKTVYGNLTVELTQEDDRESPLQVKLSSLADNIAKLGYIGAAFIFLSFLFKQFVMDNGYSLTATLEYVRNWPVALKDVTTSLILAIIVIVVAVPEGLPMMIAIVLSLNMRKLLKAQVLVRKLLGIETAGSMNLLLVDKTGTITRGVFQPQLFISGATARTYGTYAMIPSHLRSILGFTCRESTSSVVGAHGEIAGGNASDRALLSFLDAADRRGPEDVEDLFEIQFNSTRKFSAIEVRAGSQSLSVLPRGFTNPDGRVTVVKGAAEIILSQCTTCFDEEGRVQPLTDVAPLLAEVDQQSERAMRVIALAVSRKHLSHDSVDMPGALTLVGIVGVKDEVRKESKSALAEARSAGIHVVMITGDRMETAMAVAREIGMELPDGINMTSDDLQTRTDEELMAMLPRITVVARARPLDKSRLVKIGQKAGMVVGMTGDGVNDSAALMKADVGFAMGSGSEVSKEAADIVILDDNFSSITKAVLYGRTIFKSIRKFIVFQSTVNCASMVIVFMGPFLGFDFPLTLTQLLWVNLVMDTLAALAFGGEAALQRYMQERPIERTESIITGTMWSSILAGGFFIALMSIGFLTSDGVEQLFMRNGAPSEEVFLTAFFCFFIFMTDFNAFNVRTHKINLLEHITANTGFLLVVLLIFVVQVTFTYVGGPVLRTVGLTAHEWGIIVACASVVIPFDILRKALLRLVRRSRGHTKSKNE